MSSHLDEVYPGIAIAGSRSVLTRPCYRGAMIPYGDLVARLQRWRARQGLPVTVPDVPHPTEVTSMEHENDDPPSDTLEVIDDDPHRSHTYSLESIGADELTPIGGTPEPTRRSR